MQSAGAAVASHTDWPSITDKARFSTTTGSTATMTTVNGNGTSNGRYDGNKEPPPKLERITEGSIPISLIADRLIRRSYGEFLNLAETYACQSWGIGG